MLATRSGSYCCCCCCCRRRLVAKGPNKALLPGKLSYPVRCQKADNLKREFHQNHVARSSTQCFHFREGESLHARYHEPSKNWWILRAWAKRGVRLLGEAFLKDFILTIDRSQRPVVSRTASSLKQQRMMLLQLCKLVLGAKTAQVGANLVASGLNTPGPGRPW